MAVAAGLLALGGAALLLAPWRTVLAVRSQKTGELRYCAAMADGEEFVISYVHSVNRRPVHDSLRVEGTELRIVKSRFDAFGAGIPDTSTAEHPLRVAADGWLEYTVDRPVHDVALFVGRVAEHALHVRGRAIPLATLSPPGTALRFAAERQSPLRSWTSGCNHE